MPFTALVIDDDRGHREQTCAVLSAMGGEVTTESEMLPARHALNNRLVDLVVLKTDMPEMTGLRILPGIRESGYANNHTPVVGFAAALSTAEVRAFARAGYYAVLPRPVQAWRLRELIYALGLAVRTVGDDSANLAVLDALSNAKRLEVYRAIQMRGETTPSALTNHGRPAAQKALMFHLEKLEEAGLLSSWKRGRERWFSARTEPVEAAAHWMLDWAAETTASNPRKA